MCSTVVGRKQPILNSRRGSLTLCWDGLFTRGNFSFLLQQIIPRGNYELQITDCDWSLKKTLIDWVTLFFIDRTVSVGKVRVWAGPKSGPSPLTAVIEGLVRGFEYVLPIYLLFSNFESHHA